MAKSKGGGTGRGTGSKGWTRWNKTAKPVKGLTAAGYPIKKDTAKGKSGNTDGGSK
ncbi:DUF3934 family protein [Paenibacillus sp. 19GGS1-52]|uniref:DUF3934 domain-containing protein n=1 Tax=Paenibacillus monticola TaxID=2666075 RepID=A0A7X2H2J1_9BACL|nr:MULTISPECIES: DUF3934 family protein [Paenibacillus]MRN52397.1 DUF3934 domain-containing protein [Paenibacillus monticola]ULO05308.1 DUF3934 family protein [Paenibacillus sp. 19GGS1-52]